MDPSLVFPDILNENYCKLWNKFLCNSAPSNYYHHFRNDILRLNPVWWRTHKCWVRTFEHDGVTYWISFITFKVNYRYMGASGVGQSKGQSKDVSAYRLARNLQKYVPTYVLPPYYIGLPNTRGHCFLIAALIPLLHSYPFIKRLLYLYGKYSMARNAGDIKHSPDERQDPEVEYYWLHLVYELYAKYYKASTRKFLTQSNIHKLAIRLAPEPLIFPKYNGDRTDLELDKILINGLCSSMRDFCNNFYSTPGGWEDMAYADLLYKLGSQDEKWIDDFFLRFECSYFCGRCTKGPTVGRFQVPLVRLHKGFGFQDLIDNLTALLSVQEIRCENLIAGQICQGVIRKVVQGKLLNRPRLICLFVPYDETFDKMDIPADIQFTVDGEKIDYQRLASTNVIKCWKTKEERDYGHFYHEPVLETDICTGGHTYPHVRTDKGFIEVNNGYLYTCDTRLFKKTTKGSIHFYQMKKYYNLVSTVYVPMITSNPHY